MPDLTIFKDFGPSFIMLAALAVVIWKAGKALSRKFLGDETKPGLIDKWYEDERKRWDALCEGIKSQQVLCDSHGKVIVSHDKQMRAAALEACAMCKAIAEKELPGSAPLVAKHCSEIERIIGEA